MVSEVHIFSSLARQTQGAKSNVFSIFFYTRYKMLYYRYRYYVTATSNMKESNLLCRIQVLSYQQQNIKYFMIVYMFCAFAATIIISHQVRSFLATLPYFPLFKLLSGLVIFRGD
jgi:hypothetical protein